MFASPFPQTRRRGDRPRWRIIVVPPANQLDAAGFLVVAPLLDQGECDELASRLASMPASAAGARRLLDESWCRTLATRLKDHPAIRPLLPGGAVAIQCIYFQKSTGKNWLVPFHQDVSMPVASRVDHPALSGWSEKEGSLHVHAPVDLLERMIALRLHIDECGEEDGPLRVAPGSHRLGRLEGEAIAAARRDLGESIVPVPRGGALAMRPLILHASSKSTGAGQRRVLHFVFAPSSPPMGLTWRNAV